MSLIAPKALVSLKKIENLSEIAYVPEKGVVIGARATHNDLVNSALLQQRYPSIAEAAHTMANNQIRNRGTIGGNLVNAVPSADLPPILIALGAHVTLVGRYGTRTMPLEEFFVGPNRSAIEPDEILTEITIPDQRTTGSAYFKFGLRRSGALAVVGVAASVVAVKTHVEEARIVLGAVGPVPMRAKKAEAASCRDPGYGSGAGGSRQSCCSGMQTDIGYQGLGGIPSGHGQGVYQKGPAQGPAHRGYNR